MQTSSTWIKTMEFLFFKMQGNQLRLTKYTKVSKSQTEKVAKAQGQYHPELKALPKRLQTKWLKALKMNLALEKTWVIKFSK